MGDEGDAHSESTVRSTAGSPVASTVGTYATSIASFGGQPALRKVLTSQWLRCQSHVSQPSSDGPKTSKSAVELSRNMDAEMYKNAEGGSMVTDFSATTGSQSATDARRLDGAEQQLVENAPRPLPRWRCFIKSVSVTHLMLCFIPASFDDMRLLVQGPDVAQDKQEPNEPSNNRQESAKQNEGTHPVESDADDDDDELPPSIKTVHVSGNKVAMSENLTENKAEPFPPEASEDSKKSEDEFTDNITSDTIDAETEQASSLFSTSHKPDPTINADAPPECDPQADNFQSFSIPVYMYNCPLSSLTDQLVNKETSKCPEDVYQDMRFTTEERPKEASEKEVFCCFHV